MTYYNKVEAILLPNNQEKPKLLSSATAENKKLIFNFLEARPSSY